MMNAVGYSALADGEHLLKLRRQCIGYQSLENLIFPLAIPSFPKLNGYVSTARV